MDNYQIVPDDQGHLRYQGVTSGGNEVNFSLDDIANGENEFLPVPKADMPGIITDLTSGLAQTKKKIQEEWGVREVTDWAAMGDALDSKFESYLDDPTNFRSVAAGLGFGYEEFKAAESEEAF